MAHIYTHICKYEVTNIKYMTRHSVHYLTYITEKWLPYYKYMSHSYILWGYTDPILLQLYAKVEPICIFYFIYYCQICTRNKYAHQIGHKCHAQQISDAHIWIVFVYICHI